MREDTITTKVYQFDELSDDAKEHARQWWRDLENEDYGSNVEYEPFETAAKLLGIELNTRSIPLMNGKTRQEVEILWSGFSSQGDGASFTGYWKYRKGCAKLVRAEFGTDTRLWAIADSLVAFGRKYGYKVEGKITRPWSNHYCHSNTMDAEVFDAEGTELNVEVSDEFREIMRDFANWIYDGLRQEYDYRMSDESVDESIRINEYEFTETGKRY